MNLRHLLPVALAAACLVSTGHAQDEEAPSVEKKSQRLADDQEFAKHRLAELIKSMREFEGRLRENGFVAKADNLSRTIALLESESVLESMEQVRKAFEKAHLMKGVEDATVIQEVLRKARLILEGMEDLEKYELEIDRIRAIVADLEGLSDDQRALREKLKK